MSGSITRAFTEAWGDIVDRAEPFFDDVGRSYHRTHYVSRRYDRCDGRFLPVYDNEQDLAVIRSMARLMHERVPMAKAKARRLQDYTISRGFDWSVSHPSPRIEQIANRVLERFCADNHWTVIGERDSFEAEMVDGEFLGELEHVDGQFQLNWLTADHLVEPQNTRELEEWKGIEEETLWSFGIATRARAINRPMWYHIVRDHEGYDWDLLPEKRVLHWKRNSPILAKRGFSDAYTPHVYLGRADKVFANTAENTAIQAAIGYIVEHVEGTTSTQAQNIVNNLLNVTRPNPVTGVSERQKKVVPGKRVDIPAGMKYHSSPLGSPKSPIYIEVMESAVRLSGTVDAFPDYMLLGENSAASYASSLTSESPFIQGRFTDQELRKMRLVDMLEKVLRLAYDYGYFGRAVSWERDIKPGLDIVVQSPSIIARDVAAMTASVLQQIEAGLLSKRGASQALGNDYEAEQESIEIEAKEAAEKQAAAPGPDPGPDPGGGAAPQPPPSTPEASRLGEPLAESYTQRRFRL